MLSKELLVTGDSDYYVYLPSTVARKVYLYPTIIGHSCYEPGYWLRRNKFDNYLLIYIEKGRMEIEYGGRHCEASAGQVAMIDCRFPHEYGNRSGENTELSWMHFDGALAGTFYEMTYEENGPVICLSNPYPVEHNLKKILELFRNNQPLHEPDVSERITRMLAALLNAGPEQTKNQGRSELIEASLAFINEHFAEPLTLEMVAEHASLSPYYFTRVFTAEAGMTPHQYIIATRVNMAKYLLQAGPLTIKEIAFGCGFTSESSFCSTFRKWEKMTPSQYREKVGTTRSRGPGVADNEKKSN